MLSQYNIIFKLRLLYVSVYLNVCHTLLVPTEDRTGIAFLGFEAHQIWKLEFKFGPLDE